MLAKGFSETGFDGQNVFDRKHPVAEANGTVSSVSNMQAGREPPWVLLDTSRPIIWPEREPYDFQSMTDPTNPHVFINDGDLYGVVRARVNAGFGLWQLGFGSSAALIGENDAAVRANQNDAMANENLSFMPRVPEIPGLPDYSGIKTRLKTLSEPDLTTHGIGGAAPVAHRATPPGYLEPEETRPGLARLSSAGKSVRRAAKR